MPKRESLSFGLEIRAHVEAWVPAVPAYTVIAYHGYAESATAPLDALSEANLEDGLLVAPLAPHHFYNRRGEVVASWMTRLEREQRITELLSHSRALWHLLEERWGPLPLFLFGFSQGAANAYRVALLGDLPVRRCFVLGGDQPPEIASLRAGERSPALSLYTGNQDDPALRNLMENDHRSLAERGYNVEHLSLQGGHEYLPEALSLLRRRILEDLPAAGGTEPSAGPKS